MSVTQEGDWMGWSHYFLNGVARQSEDAASRASRINQLLDGWRKETAGLSTSLPNRIIESLASNPFLAINKAAKLMNVAYPTMQRAIKKLEELSIVQQIGSSKRDRVYCAPDILRILEEPAKVKA